MGGSRSRTWDAKEDAMLLRYQQEYGNKWKAIGQFINRPGSQVCMCVCTVCVYVCVCIYYLTLLSSYNHSFIHILDFVRVKYFEVYLLLCICMYVQYVCST